MAEMHTLQDCSGLVRQETLGTAPDVPVPRKTISTMVAIDEGERTRAGFVLLVALILQNPALTHWT